LKSVIQILFKHWTYEKVWCAENHCCGNRQIGSICVFSSKILP
jgi:hypothetical protein